MDTIFALATPQGKSGVAVIRISGPNARAATESMAGTIPAPRHASLRVLTGDAGILDEALVLWFPGPESFTGEDVVEFQVHGSVATINAVLSALSGLPNLRSAEPGEFTRRALENERLDLAQIEGLSDLVEAETEAQRQQALRVFSGVLGDVVAAWRTDLIRAASLLEATIDFADEEVPVDVTPEVKELINGVSRDLAREVKGVGAAERIRDGFEVAIVGPPNVGKSTLLNALAGRDAAITSSIAGTTRDVIEVRMDLSGLPVTLLDTAGIREAGDEVEALGIDLARWRADRADIRLILKDASDGKLVMKPAADDIVVVSKSDTGQGDFSAISGEGLDNLVLSITERLEKRASLAGVAICDRHKEAMEYAIEALDIALNRLDTAPELSELTSEELRSAIRGLDSLVGHVDVEHLLNEIFANFCVGK